MNKLRSAIKIHGGKFFLAKWLISHFPQKYEKFHYLEPYCGGCNVLLQKQPCDSSHVEIINDINTNIYNVFLCLREKPNELIKRLETVEYTEEVFKEAKRNKCLPQPPDVEAAATTIILHRFSRGGLGKSFAWSNRLRGGQAGDVNSWATFKKQLPGLAQRFSNVLVRHGDGTSVLDDWNNHDVIALVDPPYLPSTRQSHSAYEYEMTEADHIALAKKLREFKGHVILCGYQSALYSKLYSDWNMVCTSVANHSSQSKKKNKRVECIWTNK